MVVERSGIQRAHKRDTPLAPYRGPLRFHCFPAPCGHHLTPLEGFWRVRQAVIGAGRCGPDLHQRYRRTRQGRMAHQERPMYALHW